MRLDFNMRKAIISTVGILDALERLNVAETESTLDSISRRVKKKLTFLERDARSRGGVGAKRLEELLWSRARVIDKYDIRWAMRRNECEEVKDER